MKNQGLELQDINDRLPHAIADSSENGLERCPSIASRMQNQYAVCLRSACKRYGTKADPVVVLDGLNMTVPKGVIYGLLGASGCGKTTLLNSIVATHKLDSGEIWVLGGTPGSGGSGIPGSRLGYMPQETALYGKFSIRENLKFFGWIAGMTTENIRERTEFLIKLLMLPNADEGVENLSGGQQRRVSLAIALLHEPELLVLDEPTVGLDPILRETIWNHFSDITREGHFTVIITTHYIEETRKADLVALMRGGQFLAEASPERLLDRCGCDTLDEVFLKLCYIQNSADRECIISNDKVTNAIVCTSTTHQQNTDNTNSTPANVNQKEYDSKGASISPSDDYVTTSVLSKPPLEEAFSTKPSTSLAVRNRNHMKALLWKNCLWMTRNIYTIMFFALALPFMESAIFCVAVGRNPADLPIAVVDHETRNIMKCECNITCNSSQLGCHYVKYLQKYGVMLIPYDSEDDARRSVLNGTTYASIVVKNNYSAALYSRVQDWQYSSPEDILSSEIDVFRDVSSKIVANYLKAILYETFENFLKDYMASCDIASRWLTSSISWEDPVYGQIHPSYIDFAVPGLVLTFIATLSASVVVLIILIERKDGFLNRLLVVGIGKTELLISHLLCQFVIMCLQSATSLICLFAIFNITVKGPLLVVTALTLLTGFFGMCYGLCISFFCETEATAFSVIIGSVFPAIVVSGVIWPVEGLHYFFKPIAAVLPLTHAAESMRSILQRGSDFSTEVVYVGFAYISIWIIVCLILTMLVLKYKKD